MEGGHQHNYNVNKSLKSVLHRYFKTTTFTTTTIKRHYLALVTQSRTFWVFLLCKIIHVVFDVWYKLSYSISVIAVCNSYICSTLFSGYSPPSSQTRNNQTIQQGNGNNYEQQRFFYLYLKAARFSCAFFELLYQICFSSLQSKSIDWFLYEGKNGIQWIKPFSTWYSELVNTLTIKAFPNFPLHFTIFSCFLDIQVFQICFYSFRYTS